MDDAITIDLIWWITAVEIPALTGLFWLIWRNRREQDHEMLHHRQVTEKALTQAREALAAYKLEVAKTYASISYLKDVEQRLTEHLLRIESKLDNTRSKERSDLDVR